MNICQQLFTEIWRNDMKIKRIVFLFMIILVVSSCVENTQSINKTETSYYEFGNAYLIGKDINLWSEMPNTEINTAQEIPEEVQEPLVVIDASEPLKVIVLSTGESHLVTRINDGKEWIRIRYGNEEELKEGFVDYSNVYSDKDAKILYAIQDDADDRIKISPKNYSTSSELSLAKQYSEATKYRGNTISKKTCDLYDAALIASSTDSLSRGEYETMQEFSDRKEALINLSYSTGAKEKIYSFSESLPTKYFDYDVDTETLNIDVLEFDTGHSCDRSYGCYSSDDNFSNVTDISYVASSGQVNCSGSFSNGVKFALGKKRTNLGKFNIEPVGEGYRFALKIIEKMKLDRSSARELKETEGLEYKYLIGLSVDGNTFEGSRWTKQNCYGGSTYPYEETCYDSNEGSFEFSSNIEYLILFDETGNVVKSYFTSKYLNSFLQNDLLIQKLAYENQSILEQLDSLEEKEQLAKLFFNRIKE